MMYMGELYIHNLWNYFLMHLRKEVEKICIYVMVFSGPVDLCYCLTSLAFTLKNFLEYLVRWVGLTTNSFSFCLPGKVFIFTFIFLRIRLLDITVLADSFCLVGFYQFEYFPTAFWLPLFLLRSQLWISLGFLVSDTLFFSSFSQDIFLMFEFQPFYSICGSLIGLPGWLIIFQ